MVKSHFVDSTEPIGVFAAISQGFDRVAARPYLIVPPLLLDLLLWLGPQIRVTSLMNELVDSLRQLGQMVAGQGDLVPAGFQSMVERFNLVSALSTLPIGIPSEMSGRMPLTNPIGGGLVTQIADPALVVLVWLLLSAAGLGLGAYYQLGIAASMAPREQLAKGWVAALRLIGFGALLLVGGVVAGTSVLVAITVATLILPLLGTGVFFLGFALLFWMAVYMVFTPHGIIRYDMGVLRALLESFAVVRWNLLGTVGFLLVAFLTYWVTNLVWDLPGDASWFTTLGVLGHAFVSTTLLAGSYVFYQGRREWLVGLREAAAARYHQQ